MSSVWVRLSILSQLSMIQYVRLCVFSLPIPLVIIERMYTLSYYHHEIGSMNHYPLVRVKSWNNGMRCMSLYMLICYINNTNETEHSIAIFDWYSWLAFTAQVLSTSCLMMATVAIDAHKPDSTVHMGPTWGPSGTDRTQVIPMVASWTFTVCYLGRHALFRHQFPRYDSIFSPSSLFIK